MDSATAIKDVSFSSYLKPQNHTLNSQENSKDDAELSIFDARMYFSESSHPKDIKTWKQKEVPDDVPRLSSVSSIGGYDKNFRTGSFHGKPTTSSEASWNSRTGLLGNLPKENSPRNLPADTFLPDTGFGSTEAPRKQRISASGRPFLDGAISFTFPILTPSSNQPNMPVVIGAGAFEKPTINPRKYSQPEIPSIPGPPMIGNCIDGRCDFNPRSPIAEDDAASETSSDLFEIENFSIQTDSYPICALEEDCAIRFNSINRINSVEYERMVPDDSAAMARAEAEDYAPSEVSIDWSVVTADGGGDRTSLPNISSISGYKLLKQRGEEPDSEGEKPRDNSGLMFLGCRQVKAVSVAEQQVKRVAADGGRPPRANMPTAGSCQSARLSLAFAA